MNMKQFIIIIAIIIALFTIATAVFIYVLFLNEVSISSPEPKEKDIVEKMPEPSSGVPNYSIPGPQDKPDKLEESAKRTDERRKALEDIKLERERQNELIRAEAFRKQQEAETALLSARPEESKRTAAVMPAKKNVKPLTAEEIERMRSRGIVFN